VIFFLVLVIEGDFVCGFCWYCLFTKHTRIIPAAV